MYDQEQNFKGGVNMSILLEAPVTRTNLTTKSKHGHSTTSSILVISAVISIALTLFLFAGITYSDGMMKPYNACKEKIVGFEQRGMYPSQELFKLALSYCVTK